MFGIKLIRDGEHWTAFDSATGLKVTASPAGQTLSRTRVPELLDVSVTDHCSVNCNFCAPSGTLIQTPEGDIPIENISVGQSVYSYDTANYRYVTDTVLQLQSRPYVGPMIIIETENNHTLSLTPNHEVFTSRGWVKAGDLVEEDELVQWQSL